MHHNIDNDSDFDNVDDKLIQKSTQKIKNVYYNNTKISNQIRNKPVFTGDATKHTKGADEILTSAISTKMRLVTMPQQKIVVTVNLNRTTSIAEIEDITPYDMMVLDAVCTLAQNGLTIFTPEAISRIMTGNTKKNVSAQKINNIINSVDKMRKITIKINCEEELQARGIDPKIPKIKMEDDSYLLPVRIRTVTSGNGRIKTGYKLLEMPIIYTYAKYVKQIITVPITLLQSSRYNETEETTLIRNYLIRKIAILKNNKNNVKGKNINIQTLLTDLGYESTDFANWSKKYKSLCDIIILILQDFKEAEYIPDYETIGKGGEQRKKIESIKIL